MTDNLDGRNRQGVNDQIVLGRPFMVAGAVVLLGAAAAIALAVLEPFDAQQRTALSVALATAAGASSLPAGVLLVAQYRNGGRRSDLDAGVIVLLTSAGWLLPARVLPVVLPQVRVIAPLLGAGIAFTVLWLARSASADRQTSDSERFGLGQHLIRVVVASALLVSLLSLAEVLVPGVNIAKTVEPINGALFGVGSLMMLLHGYRSSQWALTFIGMDLLALEMGDAMATAQDVTSGPWLGASLLAFIGASVGTFGALAVAGASAQARQGELLAASLYRVQALQLVSSNEERLHDLRSGLLSVEAFAASLNKDPSVDLLVEEVARLREMVSASRSSDVVDLSRDLDRIALARNALGLLLTTDIAPNLSMLGARSNALEIVQNLIDNAVRHAPGAAIHLSAQRRGEELVIRVADEGGGIDVDLLPLVFERGFTTSREGTGLGLHIVKKLAHELGGTVSAMNRPTGGALMEVRLPAYGATTAYA